MVGSAFGGLGPWTCTHSGMHAVLVLLFMKEYNSVELKLLMSSPVRRRIELPEFVGISEETAATRSLGIETTFPD